MEQIQTACIVEVPGIEKRDFQVEQVENARFLNLVLDHPDLHYKSRETIYIVDRDSWMRENHSMMNNASLLLQSLHQAFSRHVPYSLSPEVLWYVISHEIVVHVKQNVEEHKDLFNAGQEKHLILVRDDTLVYQDPSNDWARSISWVLNPMKEKLSPELVDLMTPQFSTSTPETNAASIVSFMDVASSYCDYKWLTLCGIPSVRLEGETQDWQLLVDTVEKLKAKFTGLAKYFTPLLNVLNKLKDAVDGDIDTEFFRSIFKYESHSGKPTITGWINAFFAHKVDAKNQQMTLKTDFDWQSSRFHAATSVDAFPSHISTVPFTWQYFEKEYSMMYAAGIMGVDFHDGFMRPQLGFAVIEK